MSDKIFRLPFDDYEEQFLELVRNHQVVILAAQTGAGKSTRGPLALLRAGLGGDKLIGVSEPRRPAATLLAEWVAELHGTKVGTVVGYQIGHDKKIAKATELVYLTEGVILNQLHSDPLLSRYSIICLDEVHERGVTQDLLMALVKNVLPKRPDLKVVVMSATIDTDKFSRYFGNAPVLTVPGRVFPVEVRYARETPENGEMVDAMVEKILEILHSNEPGDILAFLPDQAMITRVIEKLEKEKVRELSLYRFLPLYGSQAPDDQKEVFKVDHRRRIIVATNIAETSLTIDPLGHIVDSGLIKATVYVDANMSALQVIEHSKAGCDQRAGRVGRTKGGICHRLYTKEDFESRVEFTKPEILRVSLDQVLLNLRCMKHSLAKILALDLLDAPKPEQWKDAETRLKMLGAIRPNGTVAPDGYRMKRFRVDPMIGRMILEGERRGCLEEVITIAACLAGTKPIFVAPKDKREEARKAKKAFDDPNSDLLTFLKVWREWDKREGDRRWARENFLSSRALCQADQMRDQLIDVLVRENVTNSSSDNDVELRKAIAAGLIMNLAQKSGQYDYFWNGRTTFVSPGSALFSSAPSWLVCTEARASTTTQLDRMGRERKVTRVYMQNCHAIEYAWLSELVSKDACEIEIHVDQAMYSSQVLVEYSRKWNGIEIERKILETLSEADLPLIATLVAKSFVNGYGFFYNNASKLLLKVWKALAPSVPYHVVGAERYVFLQSTIESFANVITKKIAGATSVTEVLALMNKIDVVDFLTGDALEAYQAEYAAEMRRQREEAEAQARRDEEARLARETAQAVFAPLRAELEGLDGRMRTLGYVFDYSSGRRLNFNEDYRRRLTCDYVNSARVSYLTAAQDGLQQYAAIVERLEHEHAERVERERIDREECLVVRSNTIRLPKSLVEEKELIVLWLAELDAAKQALEAELAFVADLKRKVSLGEVLCLTFRDRGNGTMVAEYKRELVDAPYGDDLSRYPNAGESWWCHVIPGNGPTKISLYRKVGKTKVDVEKVLKDGLDMFPGLPSQLLQ